MTRHYVYFLRATYGGPVKIGCSREPDKRRAYFQYTSPFELEIIRQIRGDKEQERWLHIRFSKYWLRREWFDFSPEMLVVRPPRFISHFDHVKNFMLSPCTLAQRDTIRRRRLTRLRNLAKQNAGATAP